MLWLTFWLGVAVLHWCMPDESLPADLVHLGHNPPGLDERG